MKSPTICRYPTAEAAELVAKAMAPLIDVTLSVARAELSDSDRARGVGEWALQIGTNRDVRLESIHAAASLAKHMEACILADEVRKTNPKHPLLECWWLRKENRDHVAKVKVEYYKNGR